MWSKGERIRKIPVSCLSIFFLLLLPSLIMWKSFATHSLSFLSLSFSFSFFFSLFLFLIFSFSVMLPPVLAAAASHKPTTIKRLHYTVYEGYTQIIDTLPLPQRKRKIYSRTWDSIVIRCSLWKLRPSFRPFEPTPEEREKTPLLKGTSTSPLHYDKPPFESKLPFPACFLSILRTGENSNWIDDQVKVGEETVESC